MFMCKNAEILEIRFTDLKNRDVQRNDLAGNKKQVRQINYYDAVSLAEHSFFRNVYNQALEQVSMIVHQNENNECDNDDHDILNIIAFTGRRGTGKTSAMLSFLDFLVSHSIDFNSTNKAADFVQFKKLAVIDAATLDKHVNIIPAIISKVIAELERELRDHNSGKDRSIRKNLSAHSLYDKANGLFNDYLTGIGALSDKSDSSNYLSVTAKRLSFEIEFREFIQAYAEYSFENRKKNYFIVCIDDVDMAPCKHAELLKSIHQYLMIPNVIVMLTANLKFLLPELQTLFYKNISPAFNRKSIDMTSRDQTDEYLKKIIPSDNRIVLPSWKKKDYLTMFPIYINFGTESVEELSNSFPELDNSEFFKFIAKETGEPYRITPKQFILMMIANRTKVYLDIKGLKYHFFEPTSLRSLYDLFFILYNMNNIVTEYDNRDRDRPSDYYLHRSQNRKRLLDYIHFTMRRDFCFDDNENEFIDKLLTQPIERRGKMVWVYYFNLLATKEIKDRIDPIYGSEFRASEEYYHNTTTYSFGEFFRILFSSSRLGVFSNNFIKFILATCSIALPAFVEKEKRDHKNGKGDYKNLVNLFGSSLLGNWRDELFGNRIEVLRDTDSNTLITAYQSNRCSIVVNRPSDSVDLCQIEALFCFLLLSPNWVDQKPIRVEKDDNEYILHAELDPTSFLINGLLIGEKVRDRYGFGEAGFNSFYPFEVEAYDDSDEQKKSKKKITLSDLLEELYGRLKIITKEKSIMISSAESEEEHSYVKSYRGFIKKINGSKIIYQKAENPPKYDKKQWISSEEIVKNIFDYLTKDYKAYHLSNMLKHIDLTYNSIKRAVTDIVYITPEEVNKKQLLDTKEKPLATIKRFYSNLKEQLEKTDKVYFAEGVDASNSFYSRFANCAIYRCIDKYVESDEQISLKRVSAQESGDVESIGLDDLLARYGNSLIEDDAIEFFEILRSLMTFELNAHLRITRAQADDIIDVLFGHVSAIKRADATENDTILDRAKKARNAIRDIIG